MVASITLLALAVAIAFTAVSRARRNDKLAAMSDAQLCEESYWADCYPNQYSRELARRAADRNTLLPESEPWNT